MACLSELCNQLSLGDDKFLRKFNVDEFVPVLVELMEPERNPDIILLAARALTNLVHLLPNSCATVVRCQAVPALVSRILEISYIDLAEQCLKAWPCMCASLLMCDCSVWRRFLCSGRGRCCRMVP